MSALSERDEDEVSYALHLAATLTNSALADRLLRMLETPHAVTVPERVAFTHEACRRLREA